MSSPNKVDILRLLKLYRQLILCHLELTNLNHAFAKDIQLLRNYLALFEYDLCEFLPLNDNNFRDSIRSTQAELHASFRAQKRHLEKLHRDTLAHCHQIDALLDENYVAFSKDYAVHVLAPEQAGKAYDEELVFQALGEWTVRLRAFLATEGHAVYRHMLEVYHYINEIETHLQLNNEQMRLVMQRFCELHGVSEEQHWQNQFSISKRKTEHKLDEYRAHILVALRETQDLANELGLQYELQQRNWLSQRLEKQQVAQQVKQQLQSAFTPYNALTPLFMKPKPLR